MSALNLGNYSAYAFDFDGTLADTIPTHTEARKEAFVSMAQETGDKRFINITPELQAEAHRYGSNPTAIIGWVLRQVGIAHENSDEVVRRTVERKNELYLQLCLQGLTAVNYAVEFVKEIDVRQPGKSFISTTAYRAEVEPFLKKYSLQIRLPADHLITFEDVGKHHLKPDPMAYQLTLNRAGLADKPQQLLVIEDTPGGVASAKQAGATAIAVCTTHGKDSFIVEDELLRPDFIVPGFAELLGLVKA